MKLLIFNTVINYFKRNLAHMIERFSIVINSLIKIDKNVIDINLKSNFIDVSYDTWRASWV